MIQNRPLILRSNRFLGSALLELGLITSENLETANEKLLEVIQAGDTRGANLLNILLYDLKVLDEAKVIERILEDDQIGLIDLSNYDLKTASAFEIDLDLCWATFTVPFDQVENITMIATSYYLSKPALKFWEEQFDGQIIWYLSSLHSVAGALEKMQTLRNEAEKEAEEEAAKAAAK